MSDREGQALYDLTHMWSLKKRTHGNRVEWWLPGAGQRVQTSVVR